jgi:hypothetical protein
VREGGEGERKEVRGGRGDGETREKQGEVEVREREGGRERERLSNWVQGLNIPLIARVRRD